MIQRQIFTLLVILIFFSGCAATGERKDYSNSGVNNSHAANQTVNYSVNWVDEATRGVLDHMEIMIIEDQSSLMKKSIKAATVDLNIYIELTSLTPNSTEMKINIQYPAGQITKSTANEIFYQTRQTLLSYKRAEKTVLEKPIKRIVESSPLMPPDPSQSTYFEFPDFQ